MSLNVAESTLDDLMHVVMEALLEDGTKIAPKPTKGECRELIAVSLELTNPRARVSRSLTRGRLFSALGELAWYLTGTASTDQIVHYIPRYQKDDVDGAIFGGYGPRLFDFDGVDQVRYVIDLLEANPSSRRAVIQLFDHQDVTARRSEVPCTCTLQYFRRGDKLHAVTYMRSNDAFWGLPHDVFCFTMLQELIARSIDAELGSYHHLIGSLHLYDEKERPARTFVDEGWHSTTAAMPPMPAGDPWPAVERLLAVERAYRVGGQLGETGLDDDPYWADLGRLFQAYAVRNGPVPALASVRDNLTHPYYKLYLDDVIDRTAAKD